MTDDELDIQLDELKLRIPYDEALHNTKRNYEQMLTDILNDTKSMCLSLLYPYEDYIDYELPKRYYNWQLRASVELYNLADKISVKDYSENGINWSRLHDGLSNYLVTELIPEVGVPKPKEESEEEDV